MRQQPTNETAGLRPVDEGQPPYLYPDYVATRLRAPKKPLIILPKTLSDTTGPAYGRGPIGELDNDLTRQHEGEPLGERIIVTGRVTDGDGSPVRNSLIEIWQANRRRARPRMLSGFGSAVRRPGALPVPRGSIGMITRDTVELHHLLEGPEDAPVLVLSNSLGTTLAMWDEQAPAMSERFRLLRYEHRGHGGSPVPPGPYKIEDLGRDVLVLLDRLEVERFSFCGLSIGGMVGMWLAGEAPERVERLVLCCTSARFAPDTFDSRARMVRAEGVSAIADAVVERWFTPTFREESPEVAEWAWRMLLDTPDEGYASCCEAVRDADLSGRLGTISTPTLVIAGADDPAAPPDQAESISDSIPNASLEVIPDAAHLANVEQPEAITQAILDHLSPVIREAR